MSQMAKILEMSLRPERVPTKLKAIDLFAGAGGFTEGADLAGVSVVWAANHWDLACILKRSFKKPN